MEAVLRQSVERVARLVQAELADLLGHAAHGPIDLAHPQFSVVASGVGKAVAAVTQSYREAAVTVLLPHIEVDGISGTAEDLHGLHDQSGALGDSMRPGSTQSHHHSQPLQVLSNVDDTGGPGVLRAQSSAGRLLAQCTQEGLEGLMTLPADSDDVDGVPSMQPHVLLQSAPPSGESAPHAHGLHANTSGDPHSRASSADVLLKLPGNTVTPARAAAAANNSTRSLSSTGRVGVAKDASTGLLRTSLADGMSRAGPGSNGEMPGNGALDLQSLQQQLPTVANGNARASLTSLSSPSGGQADTMFTSQLAGGGGSGSAAQWVGVGAGGAYQGPTITGMDAYMRQQQVLQQQQGGNGGGSQQHSAQLPQLSGQADSGEHPEFLKSVQAALSAANVYIGGGQQAQTAPTAGTVGNSGSAQRLLTVQQMPDGTLQAADASSASGTSGMLLTGNGGSSQQLLFVPAQQAGQGGGNGGPTYVTVDHQGNLTGLTSQQNALLQQQLQAQQQQAAVAAQAQAQQQQQLQALQQQLQQQLHAEAAWGQQNNNAAGSKQSIPLELVLQHRAGGGQAQTLQIDPNTNTLYTTAPGSVPAGQQVLFTNTGEAIVVDSLGNQYTTAQDNFALYGQQIDLQGNGGFNTLGLNATMLGGGGHLINITPANTGPMHTAPLGLQATTLGPDGTHSEPLPILVGVNPTTMVQQHGLNGIAGHSSGTLHAASISAGSLSGRTAPSQPGLVTAGGVTLAGTRTSLTGLVAAPGAHMGVRPLGVALAGAPASPLITRPQDLPGRFKVLPAVVQQRILALCRTNPVISVRDFDDKVVSKLSLLVDSWGVDQALAMLDHLEHRMRTKQGAMKNGPGYLDVAVCSHLDMLKAQGACPKSMKLEDYAAQVLAPPVYHELCEAVTNNRWLAWEHFDQGIIQLVKKLPVESAVEKLQEITYHSFKNVDNIKGCIMSILNSKIREDRRRQ